MMLKKKEAYFQSKWSGNYMPFYLLDGRPLTFLGGGADALDKSLN